MESVKIEGIDPNALRPDMATHRDQVVRAFCKKFLTTEPDNIRYATALFNGVVRVPLIGGMIFAHNIPSAVTVLAKAAIATHKDIVVGAVKV